jgi:hypothetical protein
MNWLNYVKDKIQKTEIIDVPFPHMIIDNFTNRSLMPMVLKKNIS